EKAAPEAKVFVSESGGAVPASQLKVPEGFKVELLRSAQPGEGSWVAMAVDEKGRLYLSPQGKEKMARVTLDAAGLVERFETINLPVTSSMGMLWAFDSLYVSGVGPDGQAIYRLRDTNGDDQLDLVQLFKKIAGGADEHGPHAIVLGPDNHLYIAHGNSTPILDQVSPVSPYRSWAEDTLLPRVMDPVATFFSNLKTPYGQVWRTDPEGKTWELFAGGFRNQYDIDFNAEGDLFTYDSDMEWDIGLPWYRPTRILHVMSGAEFGFREGNSKWPESYPDSVPAVVNIGLGCPTGVKFGTKSHFPEKYRRAFFAMDWTFGRILAVHMHPKGSSYTAANPLPSPYDLKTSNAGGDVEEFLSGKAMPVSDLEFGRDGAMYFVVGGRGTQSGLYRVSYTGAVEAPRDLSGAPALAERTIRGSLEAFHGKENGIAVETAWPHLHSTDRAIRFSARVAIESQPVAQWRERALSETEPRAALTALLALARCGSTSDQAPLLKALARFPLDSLDEEWFLNKLRVIEVSFARHGLPAEPLVSLAREKLGRQYPSKSFALNRELSELLVLLGDPEVVGKTLALLRSSEVSAEQIWYANVLREARGWTHAQRSEYFSWFHKARDYRGG
ncbi:MAG: heme-binding protein, partial [Verrucomicrobiota bacterium]